VYRSTDAGETWQNVGLKESRTIPRIVVDPKKPEVAYVAAMGNLWKDGGERGLFKTTDAGKTWKLILHAQSPHDAQTGCGDIVLDRRIRRLLTLRCTRGSERRGVLLRDRA
jgi:photosystem II stability/assembly factor-like uncharacterized protein